jgi:ferredoxin-type protein NapF
MELLRGKEPVIRPPWSIAEQQFIKQCTRCDQCIKACPTKIIERGRGGFPVINFNKGECDFCEQCVKSCHEHAFMPTNDTPAWNYVVSIAPTCLAMNKVVCQSCADQCEQRAIRFKFAPGGISKPVLNSDSCNGCGACIAPCPVNAITIINNPGQQTEAEAAGAVL